MFKNCVDFLEVFDDRVEFSDSIHVFGLMFSFEVKFLFLYFFMHVHLVVFWRKGTDRANIAVDLGIIGLDFLFGFPFFWHWTLLRFIIIIHIKIYSILFVPQLKSVSTKTIPSKDIWLYLRNWKRSKII